ncbi:MAG TPA: ATP-dependent RNA helicase HrpA, partial [Burkholderiales bacterium]|nr:ATP-dependent RNA helicase HrpA [Burkholderiales bacterium]
EREIREAADALRRHAFGGRLRGAEILPLYARLSFEEQQRVFRPGGTRRIVLATNVAETSLTVPGIRYVIDTGLARVNRYSYRNKVEQLQVEKVARASADQRAGRCGRVAPGVCIRLYSEADYEARPQYADPEILRSSLATVILRMKALRIGAIEDFPFLDPPAPRMIADGYQLLAELGGVDERNELTAIGVQLARFPIDPRIARMILGARETNCLAEMLVIAAALSIQNPRERPIERADAADRAHEAFRDERSDFLGFLKIWNFFDEAQRHRKSKRKLQALVHEHFLSHRRLREWRDVHAQLAAQVGEMGMRVNETAAGYDEIHRALLAGLLGNIGVKTDAGDYAGARGIRFAVFPGSGLRKARPKWIMAAELVETAQLYARCAARIEPDWVEPLAQRLVQRHYVDPHWERERAMVVAFERVTLYGLTIVARRRVHYGAVDPRLSREIFIRQALVAGEYQTPAPFLDHNRRLIREVQALEHKARRRDVLVDEAAIHAFYDAIVPEGIVNGTGFERWRRDAERSNPSLLLLTRDFLMRHAAASITEEQFPETAAIDGEILQLRYRFDPGHALDGVTATVPLHLLNRIDAARFDWLVPGLIREKIGYAFKALPKVLRRQLVPAAPHVTAFLVAHDQAAGAALPSLPQALQRYVQRVIGQAVDPEVVAEIAYPPHLRMNFRIVDEAGRELAGGRDLDALKSQLGEAAQLTFGAAAASGIERTGIRAWDFGDLPREIAFTRNGRGITGYPTLVDEGESVAIRLFDVQAGADAAMRSGVVRLISLALKPQMKQIEKDLRQLDRTALQLRGVAGAEALRDDVLAAIADRAFLGDDPLPRTEREFEAQLARARTRLPAVTGAALRLMADIAAEYQRVAAQLAAGGGVLARPVADIRAQLEQLVYNGFFSATPWARLSDLPRYLKAMARRVEKYSGDPGRDAKHAASIAELWQRYEERLARERKAGAIDPRLAEFRWHIEELRVSLYAQELKTPYPVSYKRLDKLWNAMRAGSRPSPG